MSGDDDFMVEWPDQPAPETEPEPSPPRFGDQPSTDQVTSGPSTSRDPDADVWSFDDAPSAGAEREPDESPGMIGPIGDLVSEAAHDRGTETSRSDALSPRPLHRLRLRLRAGASGSATTTPPSGVGEQNDVESLKDRVAELEAELEERT